MNGSFQAREDKRVTMQDVADQCRVSTATVSLVLSGDKRISPPTRKSVLAAVKQLGYRPHAPARSLALRATRTIALVLPDINDSYEMPLFDRAISGVYSATAQAGYRLLLEMATPQFLTRHFYMRLLKEQSVDGMLYLSPSMQDRFLEEIVGHGFPFIQVGSNLENVNLSYVVGDNMAGGEKATQHLIQLGHRRIGMIAQMPLRTSTRDRYLGYQKALKDSQLPLDRDIVKEGKFNLLSSEGAAQEILKKGVTAIFCGNDVMAVGALQAARNLKLHVPEDISIVGMGDIPLASELEIPLTTVRCDIKDIALHSVNKLIEMVENRGPQHIQEVVPVDLVVRSTSGPAPSQPPLQKNP